MRSVLLTTGGTGGHIFPALAVAEELKRRHPGVKLLFVGSLYGPEARLARQAEVDFEGLPVRGVMGRGVRALDALLRMGWAVGRAIRILGRFRPQVVAGFGGYAAVAPLAAAYCTGVPCVLHEQNAVAGTGNRLLSRVARRVCLSLPETAGFAAEKCVVTGNPVRSSVSAVGRQKRQRTTRRLLVTGGSQGARALNEFMLANLGGFCAAGLEIRHQTGAADEARVRAAYVNAGYAPECVSAFIGNMAEAYAWADMALCRAGASTVAELCAAGLPALLVPFPHAVHDHQTKNAEVLEHCGAARLVAEGALDSRTAGMLVSMLENFSVREGMSAAALAAARLDAAARVVAVLEDVCRGV